MPYLIGTDEAGYGPNLGPLVVSATVWQVPSPGDGADLYRRLKGIISKLPDAEPARRLAIADSKELYSPAQGLRLLERGVLAMLGVLDQLPADWLGAWQRLDPASLEALLGLPWHASFNSSLPLSADAADVAALVPKLRRGLDRAGVRLLAVRSRALFPREFNRSNDEHGNKAETLSRLTLELAAEALQDCVGHSRDATGELSAQAVDSRDSDENVIVVCDKHGGRNHYGPLLQQQFPDPWIEVRAEGQQLSSYRWREADRTIDVHFRAGGETFMPTALASMASKYLRELAMQAFNEFWCGRVRDLAPTAGYPNDAKRFRAAIQPAQVALGIADHILWRDR